MAAYVAGMADFLGWDPTLVRIAWVVLTLVTGGGGILAYVALWILLPVGTMEDGQQRPAAVALNEQNLARVAFILIGLGGLWLLANIGILPWIWNLFGGVLRVLFWPALLIGAGYLILRYTGRGLRWNVNDTTERVKSDVNGRMPTKDSVKSGYRSVRQSFPLKRSSTDKIFMGVCGGIGQKLGIDCQPGAPGVGGVQHRQHRHGRADLRASGPVPAGGAADGAGPVQ